MDAFINTLCHILFALNAIINAKCGNKYVWDKH